VADHSSVEIRRQGIGLLSAGLGLGGVVGPSLSGLLPGSSLSVSIWVALALSGINVALTAMFVKGNPARRRRPAAVGACGVVDQDTVPIRVSSRSVIGAPAIRVLVVVLVCHYFSYGIFNSQFPTFLTDTFFWDGHLMGQAELGYVLSADGAINIAVQLFLLQPLGRRLGERTLIVLIFAMMSIGYTLALWATTIPILALAVLCISTGQALARPTFVAALSVRVPSQRQGLVMGATQSLVAVTDIATPVLAGVIVGQGLYGVWVGCVVTIAVLGAAIAQLRLPHTAAVTPDG
jgi:MFS family permease